MQALGEEIPGTRKDDCFVAFLYHPPKSVDEMP
jgi:hypothetical protein